jgi:hypothetical protein
MEQENNTESLVKLEASVLELRQIFKNLINKTLDDYNDGILTKDQMERFLEEGNSSLKLIESNMLDIKELKDNNQKYLEDVNRERALS